MQLQRPGLNNSISGRIAPCRERGFYMTLALLDSAIAGGGKIRIGPFSNTFEVITIFQI